MLCCAVLCCAVLVLCCGAAAPPLPVIVPRAPPNFDSIMPESATKYTYNLKTRKWHSTSVQIKLDTVPFNKGALRLVYHMLVCVALLCPALRLRVAQLHESGSGLGVAHRT